MVCFSPNIESGLSRLDGPKIRFYGSWPPRNFDNATPNIKSRCGHHLPARIYGIFGGKKISCFCFRRNLRTLRKQDKPLDN